MAAIGRRGAAISRRTECCPTTRGLPLGELTLRERDVLEGIAEGLDNAEIALSLKLSEKTVRNHITRVFDKIGVDHRYQAIVLAREAGPGMKSKLTSAR
jgi:DNA-binding NarL/FixJ family response regulator